MVMAQNHQTSKKPKMLNFVQNPVYNQDLLLK